MEKFCILSFHRWKNEILSIGMLVMCILIVYNLGRCIFWTRAHIMFASEIVLFSGCLVGVVCMLLSRQGVLMQRPPVQQPNLKESLKYIHPNNPYLVSFCKCKWFSIMLCVLGRVIGSRKAGGKNNKRVSAHVSLYST